MTKEETDEEAVDNLFFVITQNTKEETLMKAKEEFAKRGGTFVGQENLREEYHPMTELVKVFACLGEKGRAISFAALCLYADA